MAMSLDSMNGATALGTANHDTNSSWSSVGVTDAADNSSTWGTTGSMSPTAESSDTSAQGLVSLGVTTWVLDIMGCGFSPITVLVGILGNSLSLAVLLYQGIRQTTNIILIGLTVTDLCYVLVSIRSEVECFTRQVDAQLAVEIDLYCQTTIDMLSKQLGVLSRLYIGFVAVERFIVVQYPLKASTFLTKNRMFIVSGILWIFGVLSCLHCYFWMEIEEQFDPALNETVKVLAFTDFVENNFLAVSLLAYFIGPVLYRYIPLTLVFVCTFHILRTLRTSHYTRQQMVKTAVSAYDQQQLQITRALVSICIVFLITNIPGLVVFIFRLIYGDDGFTFVGRYQNVFRISHVLVHFFMLFNSSVNFLLYIIFNRKFAATLRKILRLKKE